VQFSELENRYLQANAVSMNFRVTASGAVEADIEGSLRKSSSGSIQLSAAGTFAGQAIDIIAEQGTQDLKFGTAGALKTVEHQAGLWEALIIGFTRMGVLHNIANLSAGAMPDHAQGGVASWVVVNNVQREGQAYEFNITVADMPAGSALLSMDDKDDPTRREQVVAFPSGEMRVVEAYSDISISE